jgi:hypothetical protein
MRGYYVRHDSVTAQSPDRSTREPQTLRQGCTTITLVYEAEDQGHAACENARKNSKTVHETLQYNTGIVRSKAH